MHSIHYYLFTISILYFTLIHLSIYQQTKTKTKPKARLFQAKPKPVKRGKTDTTTNTNTTKSISNISSLFRHKNKKTDKNKLAIGNGKTVVPNRRSKENPTAATVQKLLLQTSSSGATKTTAPFSQESSNSPLSYNKTPDTAEVSATHGGTSISSSTNGSSAERRLRKSGSMYNNKSSVSPNRGALTRKKTVSTNESLSERKIKLRNIRGTESSLLYSDLNNNKGINKEKNVRPAVRKIVVRSQRMPKQVSSSGYGQSTSVRAAAGAGMVGASPKKMRTSQRLRHELPATQASRAASRHIIGHRPKAILLTNV